MKSVVIVSASSCIAFIIYRIHHNRRLKRELKESFDKIIDLCVNRELTPELINELPTSRSPSPSPPSNNTTTCSSRGSYTFIDSTENLSQYS